MPALAVIVLTALGVFTLAGAAFALAILAPAFAAAVLGAPKA